MGEDLHCMVDWTHVTRLAASLVVLALEFVILGTSVASQIAMLPGLGTFVSREAKCFRLETTVTC
jgi:hypothetical protein